METPNTRKNHLEIGIIFSLLGIGLFCAVFFYFNVLMAIMKFIFYVFVLIMIGGAIHEFGEAINKNETARKIKSGIWLTIKKFIFPLIFYGLTIWYYYVIYKEGIESFDHPIAGIIIAIALAIACILYFMFFIRKSKIKMPIGK